MTGSRRPNNEAVCPAIRCLFAVDAAFAAAAALLAVAAVLLAAALAAVLTMMKRAARKADNVRPPRGAAIFVLLQVPR